MVFSSVPLYLDPPNLQQHTSQQLQGPNNNNYDQNQNHLIPPPQQQPHHVGIGGGLLGAQQIRPTSMAEKARQHKIPPPVAPLKCPRCQSTNTKFCYYNNYNLTQPRHMCKTCRRYWTHGGALRNVPFGGGSRKNNKKSSSKSSFGVGPSSSKLRTMEPLMSQSDCINMNSPTNIHSATANSMSFMTSLQNNMGLTFTGGPIHTPLSNTNPPGISVGIPGGLIKGVGGSDHHVQFPNFLGGFEIPGSSSEGGCGGLYSSLFQNIHDYNNQGVGEGSGDDNNHEQLQEMNDNMGKSSSTCMVSPVKMEDNGQQGLNLGNDMMIMGINSSTDNNVTSGNNSNNQFWGSNMTNNTAVVTSMWTDLSGLNSSSTSHLL